MYHSLPAISQEVYASIAIPGSKSITNRALILAALGNDTSFLRNGLESRDSTLMLTALEKLGCAITGTFSSGLAVCPPDVFRSAQILVGLSGTVMRFVPPLAALANGTVFFDGDEQAYRRPVKPLLDALRACQITVTGDCLPFSIHGSQSVTGGELTIDASASSQFISGLLLSGARYRYGVTIIHRGSIPPSMPHIEMTCAMVRACGVRIDHSYDYHNHHYIWRVYPHKINAQNWDIEPDLSNAAVFFAAAAVTRGRIRVPGWTEHSLQPMEEVRKIFTQMGAHWSYDSNTHTIEVSGDQLHGISANLQHINELTPTFVAMAALADSPSTFSGIGHIRGHETDRIAALRQEINALGGHCIEESDSISIFPTQLHAGQWHCYADHRMATAGAIIGLRVPGISIEDISVTAKTFPTFPQLWTKMLTS